MWESSEGEGGGSERKGNGSGLKRGLPLEELLFSPLTVET